MGIDKTGFPQKNIIIFIHITELVNPITIVFLYLFQLDWAEFILPIRRSYHDNHLYSIDGDTRAAFCMNHTCVHYHSTYVAVASSVHFMYKNTAAFYVCIAQ